MGFSYKRDLKANMSADHLFLPVNGSPLPEICVHPLTIFSIIDHHNRRKEDQYSVIGALLGVRQENGVEVRSALPVPHSEEEELQVDMEHYRTMLGLHLRTNPEESLVGWYSSVSVVDEESVSIHKLFEEERDNDEALIHLTVDSEVDSQQMAIQPYTLEVLGSAEDAYTNDDHNMGYHFAPLPYKLETSDLQQGSLSVLLRTKDNEKMNATISSAIETLSGSLGSLSSSLDTLTAYVDQVVKGEKKGDPQVGRLLMSCLDSLPSMEANRFDELFNNGLQDKLALVYLFDLTRTQLSLAERLQSNV